MANAEMMAHVRVDILRLEIAACVETGGGVVNSGGVRIVGVRISGVRISGVNIGGVAIGGGV